MKTSTKIKTLLGIAALTAGTLATATPAFGAIIANPSGVLANEDDFAIIDFIVPVAPAINFKTTSYAPGNFSPVLTLFDGSGNYINEFIASGDLDFDLPDATTSALTPGNYRAVISAFGVFSLTGSGGNFTDGFSTGGSFGLDNNNNLRGPEYVLTISTVPAVTAVPEPSSIIGTALAGVGVVLVRRKLVADRRKHK
jgi:hypothetical protein